jgi:tetratricopeptide (TPR) repeat protein
MAKVSLRIYNREIESLIDQGHLDEAIAHCRHILKTFPKHLETYRLLGKAYLEARRHTEAMDIFSRVLMAVPDDFVSHVGMSIINDDAGKLDDAIWHMERAFESQPSNAAIQGELQRLYGRRDGVEPPKIRMTRGALAHMYMQGELYPQAISEIRAVLNQDSQRADMQVLLARAYFHSGQRTDASDVCSQLLKRYPYCFDANRILVELLPESERAESTQVHRHRVNELDPYAMYAKDSIFRSFEVPDASVNLERLEYMGQSIEMGADWASIGSSPRIASEQPGWLKAGLAESQPDLAPASAAKGETEIPDFLREAGWKESNGAREEPAAFDSSSLEGLTPAAIPDWLKEQMPPEPGRAEPEPQMSLSSETPDWLSGLSQQSQAAESAAQTEEIPDWLKEVRRQPAQAEPSSSRDVPDWLKPSGASETIEPAPEAALPSESIPDWAKGFDAGQPEQPTVQPEPVFSEPPKAALSSQSIETLGASAQEQEDAVAWLEMLAAKHGAKPEELVTDPNARREKPPEWVEQARSIAESQPPAETPAPKAGAEVPPADQTGMWLSELAEKEIPPAAVEETPLPIEESEKDWFSNLVPQPSEEPEPAAQAGMPDWLSNLKSESDSAGQFPSRRAQEELEPEAADTGLPDWLEKLKDDSEQIAATETPREDLSDWLGGLDLEEKRPTKKLEPEPEQTYGAPRRTDIPDWLSGLESTSVRGVEEEPAEEITAPHFAETEEPAPAKPATADLPEWLRGVDETETERAEPVREDLPAWLQTDFDEGEPRIERTAPSDWRPVAEESESPAYPSEEEAEVEPPLPAAKRPQLRPEVPRPAAQKPLRAKKAGESAVTTTAALGQAQSELERGDIPAALEYYGRLIKKGKFLEETIRDLRDSLYRYPVEVNIWQTLGDAYMRANRLQEALDAYNKAEELLR